MKTPIIVPEVLETVGGEVWYRDRDSSARYAVWRLHPDSWEAELAGDVTPAVIIGLHNGKIFACFGSGNTLHHGIEVSSIKDAQVLVIQDTMEKMMS